MMSFLLPTSKPGGETNDIEIVPLAALGFMPGSLGWIKIPKKFADFCGFFRKDELMNGEVFPEGCPEGL